MEYKLMCKSETDNEWQEWFIKVPVFRNDNIVPELVNNLLKEAYEAGRKDKEKSMSMISEQKNVPLVGALPVVRCKDCRKWGTVFPAETEAIIILNHARPPKKKPLKMSKAEMAKEIRYWRNLEEQGLLLQLPTEYVYCLVDANSKWGGMVMTKPIKELTLYEIEDIDKRNYYSTREAAEAALKEMEK